MKGLQLHAHVYTHQGCLAEAKRRLSDTVKPAGNKFY